MPLGDTNVVIMPLRMMEKFLLPTVKFMEFLHEKGIDNLPYRRTRGRRSVLVLPSGTVLSQERANADLEILRATTLTDDFGLRTQIQSEASHLNTTTMEMRNVLINIQKTCTLPKYDDVLMQETGGKIRPLDSGVRHSTSG